MEKSASGIGLKGVYGPDDVRCGTGSEQPGHPPFTRGAYEEMYRSQPWRIFQLSGFGNPEDEGARIRFLLDHGETGFIMEHDRNIADHLYDVDHREVVARREDVGLVGAVLLSVDDFDTVLQGIALDEVYAHPGGGVVQHGPFALASYWTVALERGYQLQQLAGTGQSDFFLTYLGCITKQQIPPSVGLRLNCDIIEFCEAHLPRWVPVSIAGYNGADSGLDSVQELGAVFANSIEYLDEMQRRGTVPLERVAQRVGGINLRVGLDLFEDAAKLRAARRIWSRLLRERYGITDTRASKLRIHSLTAGSSMRYQQPLNNIVRGTIMALAGVLGGTQSLGVSGYDEAISIPSEHAHQMSIRVQQILQNECNLTEVSDPLGGSYYVEALTEALDERATTFTSEILEQGGFVSALDSGWLHGVAAENQLTELRDIESGAKRIVGVNVATEDDSPFVVDGFQGSSDAWERGMERITALRAERDSHRTGDALKALDLACRSNGNVMPPMMDAVASRATVGEIGGVFRAAFGDWNVPIRF